MIMDSKALKKLGDLLLQFIDPLAEATASPLGAKGLILQLGFLPPEQFSFIEQLSGTVQGIQDIVEQISALVEAGGELDENAIQDIIQEVVAVVPPLFEFIKDIATNIETEFSGQDFVTQTDILVELPERLFNLLFVRFIEDHYYPVFSVLQLFQVFQIDEVEEVDHELKFPFIKYNIDWTKFEELFSDPKELLLGALRDGTGYFFNELIYNLQELGLSIGLFSNFRYPNVDVLQMVNNDPSITDWSGFKDLEILRIPFAPSVNPDIGVDIYPLIDTVADKFTGLVLGVGLDTALDFDIGDLFNLAFKISANLTNGLGFTIDEADNFKFIADLFTAPENLADNIVVGFKAALTSKNNSENEEGQLFQIGSPDGSRFEIGNFGLAFGIDKAEDIEMFVEADLNDGLVVIDFGSADGFVSNIAGNGIESNFNLGIGFSNLRGLYFKGGSGLEINLPTHIELGPIEIKNLAIGMIFQEDKLPITVDGTIAANLGPLQAVVENIGVKADFTIVGDKTGNLGPLDIAFGFKPPNGVGLSVDAGVVKGGGYLFFDFDREEYAGALELIFSEWIALKAVGLVTTRLPDGSKGFSMVIIISVEFGSGLQLGFGFTLLGVGGIIGINRTVNIDAMSAGVRSGAIESIMFPENVVANAPKIISDLRQFFPAEEDQFLIGPMAKIGYGTPTLMSLSLGLILEFPDVNITILGILKVALPTEEAAVIKLQVNFLGRIEPSNKLLWFHAFLFDSRILFITLEGGMGLLVNWGDDSNFVVSVGGFHPRFNPPPLPFPAIPRIAVNILNESAARIRIEGYFAVTSNTVQFGARAEMFFGFSAINVQGHLGFDALFQFNPFYFVFDFSLGLSVKVFGFGLFSIDVSGMLEGPAKWHIEGKAKWKITWFGPTIRININETWGEEKQTELPAIEVFPLIEREFNAITNWEAVVPVQSSLLVALRQLGESESPPADEETDARTLVLHPVGTLRVNQRKIPLALKLDKIGSQRPSDVDELSVTANLVGGGALSQTDVKEKFARGEFQDLDQAKKLSSPAFEKYESGLSLSAAGEALQTSMAVKRIIRYETIIIDNLFKRKAFAFFTQLQLVFSTVFATLFAHFLKGNTVTKSSLSFKQQKQLKPNKEVIQIKANGYSVAFTDTNRPVDAVAAQFESQAQAEDYLNKQKNTNANIALSMHVIPNTEVNKAA